MLVKYIHNKVILKECNRDCVPRRDDYLEMDDLGYKIELVIWVDNVKDYIPFVILKLEKVEL